MPEKKEGFNEPASGASSETIDPSTAAPHAKQSAADTDEPCSCCGEMMSAMFKARHSSDRSAK